jgi:predicted phage terminase large subunit-like protein
VVLNLPAINEKGEALWPEKFPLKILNKIKKTLPARDWEALYQQRPFAPEGGIYKRAWWNKYPEGKAAPECSFILMSFDTAFSDADRKRSSYTACVVIGVFQRPDDECAQLFLIDAWKKRLEYPELRSEVIRMHRDHKPDKLIIEKKASGISIIQDLRRTGIPITTYTPGTDKITRAYAASGLVENGRCYYPDRRWASEFIDALARFPSPEDDDLADAFSQALIWLGNSFMVSYSQDAERRKLEDEEDDNDEDEDDDFLPSNVRRLKPKKRAAYG